MASVQARTSGKAANADSDEATAYSGSCGPDVAPLVGGATATAPPSARTMDALKAAQVPRSTTDSAVLIEAHYPQGAGWATH